MDKRWPGRVDHFANRAAPNGKIVETVQRFESSRLCQLEPIDRVVVGAGVVGCRRWLCTVTSYTPLSKSSTVRFLGACAVMEISEPKFICKPPSPLQTMMLTSGRRAPFPGLLKLPAPCWTARRPNRADAARASPIPARHSLR